MGSTLLGEVSQLPVCRYRSNVISWHERFAKDSPDKYQELVSLCEDWLSGGQSRQVFCHKSQLYDWLCGKDQDRPRARFLPDGISNQAFSVFMRTLQNAKEKQPSSAECGKPGARVGGVNASAGRQGRTKS